MIRSRTLLLFGISLVLALVAAFIAHRWVGVMQDPSRHYSPVVIAAREITLLSPISEADIRVIDFPKAHAPEGSLSDVHQVIGKIVTQTIHTGEVLVASRVRDHLEGSLLAQTLPDTTRAVSVRVNDVSGVGGFILPGSLVDVLVSRKQAASQVRTETIVNAARVMAVGQETSAEKLTPMLVQVVTLELTPPDAEQVVQAMSEGTIQLILRNPSDHSVYLPPHPKSDGQTGTPQSTPDQTDRPKDTRLLIKGVQEVWMECTPSGCAHRTVDTQAVP